MKQVLFRLIDDSLYNIDLEVIIIGDDDKEYQYIDNIGYKVIQGINPSNIGLKLFMKKDFYEAIRHSPTFRRDLLTLYFKIKRLGKDFLGHPITPGIKTEIEYRANKILHEIFYFRKVY